MYAYNVNLQEMWSSAGFYGIHLQVRLPTSFHGGLSLIIYSHLTLYNDSQGSSTHRLVTSCNLYDIVYRGSLSHFPVRSWCMPPSGRCRVCWGFGKDGACNCHVLFHFHARTQTVYIITPCDALQNMIEPWHVLVLQVTMDSICAVCTWMLCIYV